MSLQASPPGALCIVHSQDLTPGRAGEMTSLSWPRNASVERKRSGRLCLGYCLCYQATDKQNKIGGWTFVSVKNERKKGVNLLKLIQNIHVTKWSFLMYSSTGTTLQHVSFNLRCRQSRFVSESLKQTQSRVLSILWSAQNQLPSERIRRVHFTIDAQD